MVLSIISGIYAIVIGIGILGLWLMLYRTNQIPELETAPVEIKYHLTAEVVMGLLSLISGILLLMNLTWASSFFILAMGFIIYSIINSAGYYAERKQWSFVLMFGIILIVSVLLVILTFFSL